ncbi:MAG: relaxase/mobilization nuclease domain-containing protein [Ginsengibacter sp.]
MVAKITTPKSIEAALNYNEKKVQRGDAVCLHAANYLNDAKKMNFYQKLNGFERLNSLNERATTKTLHVSLNFSPTEKPADSKLIGIASMYMDKIGFGEQPFLIYKHEDAGHPHIHIVSTTITEDGRRINTHNIGRNQSEKARKEIEQLYGLVKAEEQLKSLLQKIKPVDVEKALYGKHETKRSIANIVTAVFYQYKFSSLPEFNAALKQFNVVADRGREEGRIFRNRGLVYRILDADGNKVGVPIKASSIGCKPILQNIETKYALNEKTKEPFKQRIKNVIDDCVAKHPGSMKELKADLQQKQIYTALRQNAEGRLYGITFVDDQTKVIFNGSELGKGYSAAALQSRLSLQIKENTIGPEEKTTGSSGRDLQQHITLQNPSGKDLKANIKNENMVDILLSTKEVFGNLPFQLLKKKKRKKNHDT